MVVPWFTTPWRLASRSHRAVAWPLGLPSHPLLPFATSRHRPTPGVRWTPYSPGLSCGPISSLIPCLYPTRPPATLWRGPSGSSFIRGPFCAPSTGPSLPVPAPSLCAASRHQPRSFPCVLVFPVSLGPLSDPSHTPLSAPSPYPSIPCFEPTGPPATLWHGPTGSASCLGPTRATSTVRSLPVSFRFGGVLSSGPVFVPSFWPPCPPSLVPFPHLVTRRCCFCLFFRAPPAVSRLPICSSPFPRRPLAVRFSPCCVSAGFCSWFLFCPPLPRRASCLLVPSFLHARTTSWHRPSVTAPLGVLVLSHRPSGAWPLAVPGHARWAPLPRVSLISLLSTLPSLLSPAHPLTVVLLLRVLSAGRPRARVVSRALSRASGPPPCPPTCRLTWAASPDTPSGGVPHRPPCRPPLYQFPDGLAGRPVRLNAGHGHGVSLSGTMCTFAPLFAPCFPLLLRGPTPSVCPSLVPCHTLISFFFFFGWRPGRALRCSRAPCVCPLLFSVLPLSRRPLPPPTPVSPPIRQLSAGPACFSPTALSVFAALSLVCATRVL